MQVAATAGSLSTCTQCVHCERTSSKPPLTAERRCAKTEASTSWMAERHSALLLTLRSCWQAVQRD